MHDVICVKVTVIVFLAEAGETGCRYCGKEIFLTNQCNHLFEGAFYHTVTSGGADFEKVYKVTRPTGNVCMVNATLVVVSDIHCAEDVPNVSLLTVGKNKVFKVLQAGNVKIITIGNLCVNCIFHIGYVFSKICVFVACHDTPRTGIITINTRTDVFDHKSQRIFGGICLHIFCRHCFKNSKILNEIRIIINSYLIKNRNYNDIRRFAAFLTASICFVTVFCTGRSFCGNVNPCVNDIKDILRQSNLTADFTMLTFGKTGFITIGILGRIDHFGMTESSNNFLRDKNIAANSTMLTFGKTSFRTAGSHCFVNHFCMTKSRNYFLCFEHFVTYRAMRTCSKTRFRTSGGCCCVVYGIMTVCTNDRLCNKNCATNTTMLTFGKTRFCTSRGNRVIDHFLMTKCFNSFLCNQNFTATAAVLTFRKSRFRTSSFFRCINHFVVTKSSRFRIFIAITTTGTSMCRISVCCTSRCYYYLIVFMAKSSFKLCSADSTNTRLGTVSMVTKFMTFFRNRFLCNGYFTTYGAMLTFGKARFCTGRSFCCVDYFGMSFCRNYFLCNSYRTTCRAMLTFGKSRFCTSRSFCCVDYFGMSFCRNYFLCNSYRTAHGAMFTFFKTCCRTGRRYCCVDYFGMSFCRNYHLCNKNLFTYRAMLTFGKARFCTSRSFCCINDIRMSKHRRKHCITNGTFLCRSTCSFIPGGMTERGNFFCIRIVTNTACVGFYSRIFTGRSFAYNFVILTIRLCLFPFAVFIFIGTGAKIADFTKLHILNFNWIIGQIFIYLNKLVGLCLSTRLQFNDCTILGCNISTRCSYIHISLGRVNRAGNMNAGVFCSSVPSCHRFPGSIRKMNYAILFKNSRAIRSKISGSIFLLPFISAIDVNAITQA